MYGSKLTRKEYLMINALVQDVSFIADLHITAVAGLCMIQLPCSAVLLTDDKHSALYVLNTLCHSVTACHHGLAWTRTQASPCDICGGLNDIETVI
jgi:hypothetical protein